MIKKYEKESTWKAGVLAIAVHVVLFGALLISFNWKAAHPIQNVAEVELWDSLPSTAPPVVEHKVEPKPEPKIEPPPVVQEKPEPKIAEPKVEEPKVDIALEKKKELEKKKAEKLELDQLKKEEEMEKKKQLAALQKAMLNDAQPDINKQLKEKKAKEDALKALQNDLAADGEKQANAGKAAASKGVVDEYRRKIQEKIKGNVNNSLCGDGNPVIKFQISLLPTGELSGHPKRTKSSDIDACDEAVERAIMASQPLPMPDDVSLKTEFRNLNLTFEPNK